MACKYVIIKLQKTRYIFEIKGGMLYHETMETTGCSLIGNRHGGGNADVFPERHAAEYPVGNFSKCRNDD